MKTINPSRKPRPCLLYARRGDPWSRGHLETSGSRTKPELPEAASAACLRPRPLRASSAGDTTSRQAREIASADCVHRSRERDRGQGVAAATESGTSPCDMFSACARRGPGDRISAGGDFAKLRVLCINAKLGGRFAKFAQMQNSFAKPLEPSFCGFLQIIKCKTDFERPLEML